MYTQERKKIKKNPQLRTIAFDKRQLVRALGCHLRVIFVCEDVAL